MYGMKDVINKLFIHFFWKYQFIVLMLNQRTIVEYEK